MRYCESCKVDYPDEKKFCRHCGAALVEKAESPANPSLSFRCPSCNSEVSPGKKFCRHCGGVLESVPPVQTGTAHHNLCSRCGNPVRIGSVFCGKCGLDLSATAPAIPSAPEPLQPTPPVADKLNTGVLHDIAAAVTPIQPSERMETGAVVENPEGVPSITGAGVGKELSGREAHANLPSPNLEPAGPEVVSITPSDSKVSEPLEEHAVGFATDVKKYRWPSLIGACTVVLLVGGTLLWYFVLSPEAKISSAIHRGDLVTPVGRSAYDAYQNSKSGFSDSTRARIRDEALAKILDAANSLVQKRTQGESMLQSEIEQLVRLYSWAAELAPDNRRTLAGREYALAVANLIAGKTKAALALLLRSTEYDGNWAPAFNELGKAYVKLNDHSHAAEAYKRATAIDPNWVFPQLNLGGVYLHDQQWDLAEQSYLRAVRLDETLATTWYFLGQVYEAKKRFGDAVNAYQKALQLSATRPSSTFQPDRVRQRIDELVVRTHRQVVPPTSHFDQTARTIFGTWKGTIVQSGSASYTVTVTVNSNSGRIYYDTLNCGGRLISRAHTASKFFFSEDINYGNSRCAIAGNVELEFRSNESVNYRRNSPGGAIGATGVLYRIAFEDFAAMFRAKCAACHGPDGSGKPALRAVTHLPSLGSPEVQGLSDRELIQVVTYGKGRMPACEGWLSSDQISGLVSHIRSMRMQ